MIIHDVSDPLLELAKLFNYTALDSLANVVFAAFMGTFIYTRTYIFPRHIVLTARRHSYLNDAFPFINGTLGCFYALWALHIYWSILVHHRLIDV